MAGASASYPRRGRVSYLSQAASWMLHPATWSWFLASVLLLLAGCSFPGSVKPTVKVGLAAPFEGRSREVGYQALHGVRLAVRQWNESGGVGDRYFVELVALNDLNQADEALAQARKMAADRDVAGVLGGFSPHVARRASVEYDRLGLVFLSPACDLTGPFQPVHVDAAFLAEYEDLSGGVPPGEAAMWAYEAANRLLAGIDTAAHAKALELRAATRAALESSD